MFENVQEDEAGSFIIEKCPKQTGLLGYRLWQLLKSSERSLSDAWTMAQECLRLRAALANYNPDDDEYSISLDTACAGALAVKSRNPDLSEVEILSVLLYPLIDVLPALYAARRDELINGGMDVSESELWRHMDNDPGWLVLPASLLPVTLSEMLAAYGLYLVDAVITAMKKRAAVRVLLSD